MAIKSKSHIDLDRNELRNAVIHKLPAAPIGGSEGQVYYNSVDKTVYLHDNTNWIPILNLIGVMQLLAGSNMVVSSPTGNVTVSLAPDLTGVNSVGFDLTPTAVPTTEGTMSWNDVDGTVDLKLKGGNVTLQIGQEELLRAVNKTGATLLESEYKVVYVSGAQGQRLKVGLPRADQAYATTNTIGVVTETIADNQSGFINISGLVNGINTTGALQGETWLEGDILYLSPTVYGGLTKVKPIAPNHSVRIGYCVYPHANQGKIFVKVDNGYELGDIHNILLTSTTDKDGLFYETATGLWKNKSLTTILGGTPITGSLSNGYIPKANGTNSINNGPLYTDGTKVALGGTTLTQTYNIYDTFASSSLNSTTGNITYQGLYNGATGGGLIFGSEGSTGGQLVSGTTAYAGVINRSGLYDLFLATNGVPHIKINSAGRTMIGTTVPTDDGISSVQIAGRTTIQGALGAYAQFTIYTADGLFNANAEYSYITTPSNEKRIRFGYADYGGGQYWGRIGFLGNTNWSLGTYGTLGNNFSIGTSFNGSQFELTSVGNGTFAGTVTASNGTLIGGAFTSNYIPKATGISTLGNSTLYNDASGNVIIGGTTAGSALNTSLTVSNPTAGNYSGLIAMTAGAQRGYYAGTSTGLEIGVSLGGYLGVWTSGSERMRITNGGNFLIGTTTDAGYKLDVNGTGRFSGLLTVNNLPATTATNYQFKNVVINSGFSTGYTSGIIQSLLAGYNSSIYGTDIGYSYDGAGYGLHFSTNSSTSGLPVQRLIITSSGAATFSSSVTASQYKLSSLNTAPLSAIDTGTTGEIRVTSEAIHVCIATNTWVRVLLATWV